jgi:hypothetical protein
MRPNDKEVVVLSGTIKEGSCAMRGGLSAFFVMMASLSASGCASITQDVHRYYSQMAHNYKEAEQKARMEAMTLEGESRSFVQVGDLRGYSKTQKELARVKSWQSHCSHQRERFEEAAQKMEGKEAPPKAE